MKLIDLHVHTTASSDGQYSPKELIGLAIKKGLKVIAITDHDTISGIKEISEYSNDIKIIPGIEITCKDEREKEVHILGLFLNLKPGLIYENMPIKDAIDSIRKSNGISILAHPGIYSKSVIKEFIKHNGDGLEVYYPYEKIYGFTKETSERIIIEIKKISQENNLLISGGSDFHGPDLRPVELGDAGLNEEEFELLFSSKYLNNNT